SLSSLFLRRICGWPQHDLLLALFLHSFLPCFLLRSSDVFLIVLFVYLSILILWCATAASAWPITLHAACTMYAVWCMMRGMLSRLSILFVHRAVYLAYDKRFTLHQQWAVRLLALNAC